MVNSWMNDFFVGYMKVEVSRSQILFKDKVISMEPKVLQVLALSNMK